MKILATQLRALFAPADMSMELKGYAMEVQARLAEIVSRHELGFGPNTKTYGVGQESFVVELFSLSVEIQSMWTECEASFKNASLKNCIAYFGDAGRMVLDDDLTDPKEIASNLYKMLSSLSTNSTNKLAAICFIDLRSKQQSALKEFAYRLLYLIWKYIEFYRSRLQTHYTI